MAESSNLIKALVIKAKDARIVGDKLMKRYYANLFALPVYTERSLLLGSTPSGPTTTRSC